MMFIVAQFPGPNSADIDLNDSEVVGFRSYCRIKYRHSTKGIHDDGASSPLLHNKFNTNIATSESYRSLNNNGPRA